MGFILIILLNCTKMGFDKIKFGGRVKIEEKLLMHKCKRVVIWGREMFKKTRTCTFYFFYLKPDLARN